MIIAVMVNDSSFLNIDLSIHSIKYDSNDQCFSIYLLLFQIPCVCVCMCVCVYVCVIACVFSCMCCVLVRINMIIVLVSVCLHVLCYPLSILNKDMHYPCFVSFVFTSIESWSHCFGLLFWLYLYLYLAVVEIDESSECFHGSMYQ